MKRQITAVVLAVAMAAMAGPLALAQAPTGQIAGTAKNEAKKPYADYVVRARTVTTGAIAATQPLDDKANFVLPNLAAERYVVELVNNRTNAVVCTEGPIVLASTNPSKNDVNIKCGVPALAWLLPAAAAAAVAAGVTRANGESASGSK